MTGSPLYDATVADIRARTSDPLTSHQAGATTDVVRSQRLVLELLEHYGDSTDVDIAYYARYEAQHYNGHTPTFSESRLRTARKELIRRGLVEDSMQRAQLTTGRTAIVWRLTDNGLEMAA